MLGDVVSEKNFAPVRLQREFNVRVWKTVQVHIDQTQAHHVRRDVVADKVLHQASALVRREHVAKLIARVVSQDMLVRRNQKASRTTGRIANGFILLWLYNLDN